MLHNPVNNFEVVNDLGVRNSACMLSRQPTMSLCECRVPEECPGWAAELIKACMLEDASARPTSKEIYRMLLDNDDDHT